MNLPKFLKFSKKKISSKLTNIFPYEIIETNDLHKRLRSPIADLVPYVEREAISVSYTRNKIMVIGKHGYGKTREAMEILRRLDHDRKSLILLSLEGVQEPSSLPEGVKDAERVILFVDDFSRRQADEKFTKELQEQASSFSDETTRLKKTISFFEDECKLQNFYVIITMHSDELRYLQRVGADVSVFEQFEVIELTPLEKDEIKTLVDNLALHFDEMEIDVEAGKKLLEYNDGSFSAIVRFFALKRSAGRYRITVADAEEFKNMQETFWEDVYFRGSFWERRVIESLSILRQCAVEPYNYIIIELCKKVAKGFYFRKEKKIRKAIDELIKTNVVTSSGKNLLCYDLFLKDKGYLEEYIDDVARILLKFSKDKDKQHEIYSSLFNLAVRLYYREKYDLCNELNNRIMGINPGYASAHYDLGVLLYDFGRYEEAQKEYLAMLEKFPNDPEAHFKYGSFLYRRHRYEEAEKSLKDALRLDPDYGEAHFKLAQMFHLQRRIDEAQEEYEEAIRNNPFDAKYRTIFAVFLKSRGRYPRAKHEYDYAIRIDPDYAVAHANFAVLLQSMGLTKEAMEAYRKALELDPDNPKTHRNFGVLLQSIGRRNFVKKAEREYHRAIELNEDFAQAFNNLGALLMDQKRYEEAEKAFEKAIELENIVDARYNLTLIYDVRGESEKSIEHWEAILGINE